MTYDEFAAQWNSDRFPASIDNPGDDLIMLGVGVAALDSPAPGPADIPGWLIALLGACVYLGGVITGGGTVALPLRPVYEFEFDWQTLERGATEIIAAALGVVNPRILYRGTALRRALQTRRLLWLTGDLAYAAIYAHFDGAAERDTSAISIYGILEAILEGLILGGHVTTRFQVGLEYGFDAFAQLFLAGTVIIPIPDFFQG